MLKAIQFALCANDRFIEYALLFKGIIGINIYIVIVCTRSKCNRSAVVTFDVRENADRSFSF